MPEDDWIDVAAVDELEPGSYRVVEVDDAPVAVFNVSGEFYALEDACSHDGGQLTGGKFEGCEIECPRHAARFDIRTGRVLCPPAYENIHSFPTRIVQGRLQVRDDRWD